MRFAVCSSLLLLGARAWAAQNAAPETWPDNRYDPLVEQWPFAVATPKEEPKEEAKAPFAAGWFLSGLSKVRDEKGVERDFVSIRSQDKRDVFSLIGDETRDGVSIASVEWSPQVGKSTVTLKKGTEYAKVEFNQMELQAAPAPGAPPAMQGGAGIPTAMRPPQGGGIPMPGQPVNMIGNQQFNNNNGRPAIPRPVTAPGGVPQPMVPGAAAGVPRPAAAVYPAVPGAANTPGAQPAERRKIRVINSHP